MFEYLFLKTFQRQFSKDIFSQYKIETGREQYKI